MPDSSPATPDLPGEGEDIFSQLGSRPVINAAGAYTILGGSTLSSTVRDAMEQANRRFADMKELLESSGKLVAEMLDCEAALVTSGGAAALALASAACLTRNHPEYLDRLPDTQGIPNEILVHRARRQKYDRCVTIPGARVVEIGESTVSRLRAAISERTAAVYYLAPSTPEVLPLDVVIREAHEQGLPVIVDAAGLTYPLDNLRRYTRLGADLVAYAGKYFDAPHSTGLLLGNRELVELAGVNSFIGFETSGHLTIGRPMKLDRQEIAGCVVALREWLRMDHEERLLRYGERCDAILDALRGLDGVEAYRISERETPSPVVRDGIRIRLSDGAAPAAESVAAALREGDPRIWTRVDERQPNTLNVSVAFFEDEDLEVVCRRLREVLV